MSIYTDAKQIIRAALAAAMPDAAVKKALAALPPVAGRLVLIAVGKAAWQMAAAAEEQLNGRIDSGIVITKYGHSKGNLDRLTIYEAGHPVPDENSYAATKAVVKAVQGLGAQDLVLFLLSGGGSALFELPKIAPAELESITRQLLAGGAEITEINTLRKHLSAVKGGRFARLCAPAQVFSVVLSDILGDPLEMIASGPAYPDSTTPEQAMEIAEKYGIRLSAAARRALLDDTPKTLDNVQAHVTGSVRQLCAAAATQAAQLGYAPEVLTDCLCCEAREAGRFLAAVAQEHQKSTRSLAFLCGGETVVHLTGSGKGGRNQEVALSAAQGISGMENTLIFSFGSDGTDGPTDAAGGWADGRSMARLRAQGIDIAAVLRDNDAYHALQAVDALIVTGPTGTNVNDLSVLLIRRDSAAN